MKKLKILKILLISALLVQAIISCTTVEIADLPPPMENVSSSSDGYNTGSASSSSGIPFNRSSSSECVGAYCYTPSSSSAATSSSSVILSSSSVMPSSSSTVIIQSSSSQQQSSSSISVGGGLCTGFIDGTQREHYGKNKPQFCDPRDGTKYVYVTIGTQVWTAENLNYNASGSVCYNNLESNCDIYGKLYSWAMAMNGKASSTANPSGVQGVCPTGWHIPSDGEWSELMEAVGGLSTAGKHLKATTGWSSYSGIVNMDTYGFSALPSGYGNGDGYFGNVGGHTDFWSATEYDASYTWVRNWSYSLESVLRRHDNKSYLFSVRCLKN